MMTPSWAINNTDILTPLLEPLDALERSEHSEYSVVYLKNELSRAWESCVKLNKLNIKKKKSIFKNVGDPPTTPSL